MMRATRTQNRTVPTTTRDQAAQQSKAQSSTVFFSLRSLSHSIIRAATSTMSKSLLAIEQPGSAPTLMRVHPFLLLRLHSIITSYHTTTVTKAEAASSDWLWWMCLILNRLPCSCHIPESHVLSSSSRRLAEQANTFVFIASLPSSVL